MLPALRSLAGFILGMATWAVGRETTILRLFARPWAGRWIGPAALLAVLCLLLGGFNDLLIYALLPVVVLGFHRGHGIVWQAFAAGPVHRLGVLSYAIYLIHFILLKRFPFDWAPMPEVLSVYLLITLGLAVLAHHLIEIPGRALLRGLGERAIALLAPASPALAAKTPLRDGLG
jgi:peptidoglycan/LPS O-acetylase OafA/YrhL